MTTRALALLGCLLGPLPALAGIDARVRGLGSDEETNAYKQLAILNYAIRVDQEKGEYDTAEVERLFEQGEQDIKTALQPFGWYNASVTSDLRGAKPDWTVTYTVDAGPRTDVARIDVVIEGEGRQNPDIDRVVRDPRMRVGTRLKHEEYEALKARLQEAAYGAGFLDATFTRHVLLVDAAANKAEVQITMETGPRWYFGEVTIEQGSELDVAFLRRYVRADSGAPFDSGRLLATQFAFTDLDYFQSVEIETFKARAGPERQIPVTIRTTPKKRYAYRFGAGYGTDTGARALTGVEFRRLNSGGHKLRIDLRPSENISTAIAEYKIPYGHFPGDSISFPVQGLDQNFQGIDEKLYSFGVSYNRQIGKWQRRYYLTYTHDDYTLEGEAPATSVLLTPGIAVSRTQANDPIRPTRGWYAFLDVHGGSTEVLSDTSFIAVLLRVRAILPVAPGVRLLLRGEEGAAFVHAFATLPPSQRFFAGGDESVRGYAYHSLGPRDERGRVIGGKFLTTGSAEIDFDIGEHYGIAAFFDAGGADDRPNVLLHYGAGIGFRYRAPFGSVAIDVAHPFDRDAQLARLHLGVRIGL